MVGLRCFSVARCQTPSGIRLDGFGWVSLGPVRARQGPIWSRMGPYISRTIHRGSAGPVGPYRVPTGFRRNPVLARIGSRIDRLARNKDQMNPTACPDPFRPLLRSKTGKKSSFQGKRPPADRRRHRRTPFPRSLPGLGGPQLLLAQPRLLVSMTGC